MNYRSTWADQRTVVIDPATVLLDEVRLLMHRIEKLVVDLHADLAVSTPERAVLEYLHRRGPATVPDIARARGVSRQHIQTIVNGLLDHTRVEAVRNPAHRRSPLIVPTDDGRRLIEEMLEREQRVTTERLAGISGRSMLEAADMLAEFRNRL
jgi:DNA-binding MarR family transcriptional regulator